MSLNAADLPGSACFPFLLAMLTSDSGGAQDLTQNEQILHHYVAMVKKDAEAYCAYSRSRSGWEDLFKDHLASCTLIVPIRQPFSDLSR